jgi:hypothetical protein
MTARNRGLGDFRKSVLLTFEKMNESLKNESVNPRNRRLERRMIPTKAKNRRQKAKEALDKAIKFLVDMGYTPELMDNLCIAYIEAKKEHVL